MTATALTLGASPVPATAAPSPKPAKAIEFQVSGFVATETDYAAAITVVRNWSSGRASVLLSIADGTADSSDYTGDTAVPISFDSRQTSVTVYVPLVDDGVRDEIEPESVNLSLSNPSGRGVTVGANATAKLWILDDNTHRVFTSLDDLEGDTSGWTATGLWHEVDENSPCLPSTHAFHYGQDSTCDYITGETANSGTLTSPDYTITGDETHLRFRYYLQTEDDCSDFDKTFVEVSYDSGTSWQQVADCLDQTYQAWSSWPEKTVAIAPTGTTLTVRFTFDTVNAGANYYDGWFIDDMAVDTAPSPASGAFTLAPGQTASVVGTLRGCNALTAAWSDGTSHVVASGGGSCGRTPVSFAVSNPADASADLTFTLVLRDDSCSSAFHSDGTGGDHATVFGSGPYSVDIADAGSECAFDDAAMVPAVGDGNLSAVVSIS